MISHRNFLMREIPLECQVNFAIFSASKNHVVEELASKLKSDSFRIVDLGVKEFVLSMISRNLNWSKN